MYMTRAKIFTIWSRQAESQTHKIQVGQLSQTKRAAGWVSFAKI